ncbi:hypothetical protein [Streptomyces sp. NPDC006739]|uniref:hypothetical protein n=1 Tax=Streptomyces sp. NPDC006739 TaxID=3364763 RepID=UPI0036983BF5
MRSAAVAAGLVGALALTGCGGGGGSKAGSSASPAASAGSTASSGGSASGGVTSSSDKLQGSWITTSKGKIVALIVTGKRAGVFVTGGTVCSGTAGKEAGMEMIHLTCTDGSKDRATGMVDSADKSTLKVTWSGKLGQEAYNRAEGGKLPSGLPKTVKR